MKFELFFPKLLGTVESFQIGKWPKKTSTSFPGIEYIFVWGVLVEQHPRWFLEIFQVSLGFAFGFLMSCLHGCHIHETLSSSRAGILSSSPWSLSNFPLPPQDLTPRGQSMDVCCMERELTFAMTISLVCWHRTPPFPRPINIGKRQTLHSYELLPN